jgi:hypothetical protein
MPKAIYYQIYLVPKEGVDNEMVKKKIDLSLDWFKYDNSMWVVYSTSDVIKWQTRLKPLVEPTGSLFICEINLENRNGWMDKKFWEWLNNKK